jgi:two-component system, chemotaxis family, protein-glutamate methylesterase/glutaminase
MSAGVHTDRADSPFDVVVIAASFGGPTTIGRIVAGLPTDFPAAVLIVQHRTPTTRDGFATALQSRTTLPVGMAGQGEPVTPGAVTVLPARHTATLDAAGALRLQQGADFRLADPLIRSVAETYGRRALCVVLTGRLDDAAAGVRILKRHGGRTIVEDPGTAAAAGMPCAALATGCVDLVMPVPHIAPTLIALTMAPGAADLFRVPASPWANFAAA